MASEDGAMGRARDAVPAPLERVAGHMAGSTSFVQTSVIDPNAPLPMTRALTAGRAYAAIGSLLLVAVILLVSALVHLSGIDLFSRYATGDRSVRSVDLDQFLVATEGLGAAYFGAFALAGVVWLWWLHGRLVLLRDVGAPIRTRPAAAIGWWFVPVANAVKPYLIVREVGRRAAEVTGTHPPDGLITFWWSMFLGGEVIVRVAGVGARAANSVDGLNAVFAAAAIGQLVGVVAAGLAIAVVSRLQFVVSMAAARASGLTVTDPRVRRIRARPVWFVVALTMLSGGIYAIWWFGRTWAEILHRHTNDRRGGLWHAIGLTLPIYGSVRAYRHFAAIATLPSAAPGLGPTAALLVVSASWLTFPAYYLLQWPYTLAMTFGWAAMYATLAGAGQRSLEPYLEASGLSPRLERADIVPVVLSLLVGVILVLPPS